MRISHVGSLPFLDVGKAMDFTFSFDIPVLFTLPQLDEGQYMGRDIERLKQKGSLPYEELFIERCFREEIHEFKFQLIGPISFQKYFRKEENLKDVAKELSQLYTPIMNRFVAMGMKPFFFLDEPALETKEEVEFLNKYENYLPFNGVHCCGRIDLEIWKILSSPYKQLDWSLYPNQVIPCDNKVVGGLEKLSEFQFESLCRELLLTPSCGLANCKNPQEILAKLQALKYRLLALVKADI